jgi:hypothetical protein
VIGDWFPIAIGTVIGEITVQKFRRISVTIASFESKDLPLLTFLIKFFLSGKIFISDLSVSWH